jgi:hypothetical protein
VEGDRQARTDLTIALLDRPPERLPQIGILGLQPV